MTYLAIPPPTQDEICSDFAKWISRLYHVNITITIMDATRSVSIIEMQAIPARTERDDD